MTWHAIHDSIIQPQFDVVLFYQFKQSIFIIRQ